MCSRLNVSLILAVLAIGTAAMADDPPAAEQNEPENRSLTIDIGSFTPYAKGIVIQLDKDGDGNRSVQVQVDKETTGGTGVDVNVGRAADGQSGLNVEVERNGEKTVDLHVGDSPLKAEKPTAAPAMENYLGLFTRRIPEPIIAQLGSKIGENRGVLVMNVVPDSPAAKAGIKRHDILVRYDDHDIATVAQLKELIAADKPGRTVKLKLVSGGEVQDVDVAMGQRRSPELIKHESSKSGPNKVEANSLELRREGSRPIIINKRLIQVPGVTIHLDGNTASSDEQPGAEKKDKDAEDRSVKQDGNRKLLVTTQDGKTFKIELEYIAADGAKVERNFEGTPAEIDKKAKDLPEEIRSDVSRALKDFTEEGDNKQSRAFRFQIEPIVEGNQQFLRLSIRRLGEQGETRVLEVRRILDGREPAAVGDLMKIDVVASELENLGPAIREKVEATLNRIEIPQVHVDVEKSQ